MNVVKIRRSPEINNTSVTIPSKLMPAFDGVEVLSVELHGDKLIYRPMRE